MSLRLVKRINNLC